MIDRRRAIARNRRDYAGVMREFGWGPPLNSPQEPKNRRPRLLPVTGELLMTPARQQYFDAVYGHRRDEPLTPVPAHPPIDKPVSAISQDGRLALVDGIRTVRIGVRLPGERRPKRKRRGNV